MPSTPTQGEFHNIFARSYKACEEARALVAKLEDISRRMEGLTGDEWERRQGLISQCLRQMGRAMAEMDGVRTKLKNGWDPSQPFPNPIS